MTAEEKHLASFYFHEQRGEIKEMLNVAVTRQHGAVLTCCKLWQQQRAHISSRPDGCSTLNVQTAVSEDHQKNKTAHNNILQ